MTNHDRFDELPSIYALGTLDGEELREFEEHLKSGCAICEQTLKETEMILSLMPYSLPPVQPSPELKERLLKKIKASKKMAESSYEPIFWERLQPAWFKLAGAVALALLVLLFISNLFLIDRLREQRAEVNRLKEQVTGQNEVMEFLQNPNTVVVSLVNLQPGSKAHARVLWDKRKNKALFYGLSLPPTPLEKTYQLWVIADNTPVSAGVFKVDEKGNCSMMVEALPEPDKVQKFAVTLEPEGGMPKPTGDMYLVGTS
jgi:anti-sigma-K factor RskA